MVRDGLLPHHDGFLCHPLNVVMVRARVSERLEPRKPRRAAHFQTVSELEDFFLDLVGAFDDARACGLPEFWSGVGSRFESKARAYADRLGSLAEGFDLTDNPV